MRTKKRWLNADVSRSALNGPTDGARAAAVMEETEAPVWAHEDSSWFTKHFPAVPWCNRGGGGGGGSRTEEEDECVTWCRALTVVHYVAPGRVEAANIYNENTAVEPRTASRSPRRRAAGPNGRHVLRLRQNKTHDSSSGGHDQMFIGYLHLISDVIKLRLHHRSDWKVTLYPWQTAQADRIPLIVPTYLTNQELEKFFLRSAASPSSSSVVAGSLYPVPRPNI